MHILRFLLSSSSSTSPSSSSSPLVADELKPYLLPPPPPTNEFIKKKALQADEGFNKNEPKNVEVWRLVGALLDARGRAMSGVQKVGRMKVQ
jgi:hypothetical protein